MGITLLDTSVFGALNRANSAQAIAKDLQELAASGETLMVGYSAYQQILNTPDTNLRSAQLRQIQDFKMQIQQSSTMAECTDAIGIDYANATVDKTGTKLKLQSAGVGLDDLPILSDVKVQMARTPNQKVKLFTVERMVKDKVTIKNNYGIELSEKSRVVNNMGERVPYNPRALGVQPAVEPTSAPVVEEVPPPPVPEMPIPRPSVGGGRLILDSVKAGFKDGLKGLLSADTIVGVAATVFLAYADKVAAETAIRQIQIFFLKEGFAKGIAAAVMGWTEDEVATEALNRVTAFRVEGMADAAGHLTLPYILKLAEIHENYAVSVGYYRGSRMSLGWKKDMAGKGFAYLKRLGYHWDSEDKLFEYDFLAKLA